MIAADCGGQASAPPLTLATVTDYANMRGLFVDEGAVYFGAATDGDAATGGPSHGVLRRVAKDGGAAEELWTGTGWPLSISATDAAIFLMTYDYRGRDGRVRMRARDGATFQDVGSWFSMGTCGSLTTAGGDAYWTDITGSAGDVMSTAANGQTRTLIDGADPCPGLATARSGQLYWVDLNRDIRSVALAGGDERLIWRGFSPQYGRQLSITAFTASPEGSDLLFAAFDGRVLRLDPAASSVQTLLADRDVVDLATDGSVLYAADKVRREIVAVPVDGGAADVVAAGIASPIAVRVDGRYVYWIDAGQKMVMRAPKCGVGTATPRDPAPAPAAAPCEAPAAKVLTNVSDHQRIGPIAIASDFVYFGASTSLPSTATGARSHAAGAIRRVPSAGGPVEEVWSGDGLVRALAVDGGALYFVTGWYDGAAEGQVVHGVLADAPHTEWTIAEMPLLELQPSVAAGNQQVFWTSGSSPYGSGGQVNRADLTGAGASVIATTSLFDTDALMLLGSDVYYGALNNLSRVPQSGGDSTPVTSAMSWPASLAWSSAGIVWASNSGGVAISLQSGEVRQLIGGYLGVDGLVADNRTVYIASSYLHQVLAVPATGGNRRVVACASSGASLPVAIALDDDFVYWADQNTMQLLRAPKQ